MRTAIEADKGEKLGGRHFSNSVNEKTVAEIGEESHVSPTSVTTARAIAKENPEIFEQVKVLALALA